VYIAARGRSRKDNGPQVELTWRAFFYFGKLLSPSVCFGGEYFANFALNVFGKRIFCCTQIPSFFFFFFKWEIFLNNRQNSPQFP
jgi:hypothetical protein